MTDAIWSDQGTTPEAVASALRELLHERHTAGGMVPERVLNMLAFVDRSFSGEIVNRLQGEPANQLHERHDASDFDTKTQDKIAAGT